MIDLAANSSVPGGARLLFVSSISVLSSTSPCRLAHCCYAQLNTEDHPTDKPALEARLTNARCAAGIGYGESKWVSESILLNAREAAGILKNEDHGG